MPASRGGGLDRVVQHTGEEPRAERAVRVELPDPLIGAQERGLDDVWASCRSRVKRYAVRIARTWCRRTRASSPRMSPRCKCSIAWRSSMRISGHKLLSPREVSTASIRDSAGRLAPFQAEVGGHGTAGGP